MFEKNFNIVVGDRSSYRTTFLIELSRAIRGQNRKILFLGGTDEFQDFANDSITRIFDHAFFYKNDIRLFHNIKELVERDNYEYIFIDDIDYIPNTYIKELSDISVRKIGTSLPDSLPIFNQDINLYQIKTDYDDSSISSSTFLEIGKQMIDIKDIIKTIERDQKLNTLLK
jgi:hypothetical protein